MIYPKHTHPQDFLQIDALYTNLGLLQILVSGRGFLAEGKPISEPDPAHA